MPSWTITVMVSESTIHQTDVHFLMQCRCKTGLHACLAYSGRHPSHIYLACKRSHGNFMASCQMSNHISEDRDAFSQRVELPSQCYWGPLE